MASLMLLLSTVTKGKVAFFLISLASGFLDARVQERVILAPYILMVHLWADRPPKSTYSKLRLVTHSQVGNSSNIHQ